MHLLETTLSTEFIPGTNLSGSLASADWRYLLPVQELDGVLCIGSPSAAALLVLSKIGRRVYIAKHRRDNPGEIENICREKAIGNIQITCVDQFSDLPLEAGSMDLIYLAGRRGGAKYSRGGKIAAEISRLLKPGGALYFEAFGWGSRLSSRKHLNNFLQQGFCLRGSFWLTPFSGELRTALPLGDEKAAAYFFRNVIYGQSLNKRAFRRAGSLMSRAGMMSRIAPRRAFLLNKSQGENYGSNGKPLDPPEYLQAIAAKAGVDLSRYTFGLSARGEFNANKVIFFLFGKNSREVEVVIKMTRSPEFNRRLENEFRILTRLSRGSFVRKSSFPELLFFDYHNGLAVMAIRAVRGKPFRTRTLATPDCPFARDAIEWITQLGTASANPHAATAGEVAATLEKLFNFFKNVYSLTAEEENFVSGQIETLAAGKEPFPLVFQHGDPGTWNMMVSDETNRVVVIDWEAGEPQGVPLWDLFYFFRTYASWVSRQQGRRNTIKNFAENFFSRTELHSLLVKITERYRANVGLDRNMIKPLFYTCWMHRALKESTRLAPESLDKGHYFNVLRMCIKEHNNPALRALFQEE